MIIRDKLREAGSVARGKATQGLDWYKNTRRRNQLALAALLLLLLLSLLYLSSLRPSLAPQELPPAAGGPLTSPQAVPLSVFLPLVASSTSDMPVAVAAATATPWPTATPLPTSTPTPTRTPTPTSTPTPSPPTPTATPFPGPVLKVTKMGVGVYTSGGGYIMDAIYRAKPTVILLMDPSLDFAREVRRWFPKALIMGRRFVAQQPLDNPQERGRGFADYVAELAVPLKGVVNAWMSYNEVTDTSNYDNYRAYNAFQVAFAQRLQGAYGIPAVAGNDATGTVTPEDYARYFGEAIRTSQYFGIHAYAPPEAKSLRQEAEYYVLRYRLIHQALEKAGIQHGPFILTETGLWHGWRGYVSEESMAREFIWLADELDQDEYVLGQAVFGIFDREEWQSFDIMGTSLPDRLGRYKEPVK